MPYTSPNDGVARSAGRAQVRHQQPNHRHGHTASAPHHRPGAGGDARVPRGGGQPPDDHA